MSLDGKTRLYTGVFTAGTGGYALYLATWSNFNANRKELAKKKVYLVDIEAFYANGATYYLGVYRTGARRVSGAASDRVAPASAPRSDVWSCARYELLTPHTCASTPTTQAPLLRFLNGWSKFVKDWKMMNSKGRRLVDFEYYQKGNKLRYVGM